MTATRGRACDGKKAHGTRQEAEDHLMTLVRESGAAKWMLAAYRCRWCGRWHVGHKGRVTGTRRKP